MVLLGPAKAPSSVTWGQVLAYAVASSVPCHLSTGAGGRQRRLPTGGAAYQIPRKMLTPFFTKPRTWPSAVVTTGPLLSRPSWAAAGPVARPAMRSAQAAKLPPQRRKSLLERTLLSICRAMLFLPTQMSIFGALAIKSANTLPGLLGIGDTWSSVKFFIMKWPASEGEEASASQPKRPEPRRAGLVGRSTAWALELAGRPCHNS